MPHMARAAVLLLASLVSIGHVTARALPQFYPVSGSNGGSSQGSNSMNIESDGSVSADDVDAGVQLNANGNPNILNINANTNANNQNSEPFYWEEEEPKNPSGLDMVGQEQEGLAYDQGGKTKKGSPDGGKMLLEEEEGAESADAASVASTQADLEEYVDAGFEPDEEALQKDLEFTGGRQMFDIAPESLQRAQTAPIQESINIAPKTDVLGSGQPSPNGSQIAAEDVEDRIIEEEIPSNIYRPQHVFDISALPRLASEEVVTVENEFDEEGNMRILTTAPDIDAEFKREQESDKPGPADIERNKRLEREKKERLSRRRSQSGGRKFLPDDQLPPNAELEWSYVLRNERGEPINEYGLLLDENGQPIPEPDDPYADEQYDEEVVDRVIDQTGQSIKGADKETGDESAQDDTESIAAYPGRIKPRRQKFERDLNPYLRNSGTVDNPYDVDDSRFAPDNTSERSNIARSYIKFRKPERQMNGRGTRRQKNMSGFAQRPGPRTYRNSQANDNPYSFLDQPYNDISPQEIQDSMVAEAAIEAQRRSNNSNQQGSNQAWPQTSDQYTAEEIMLLYELQAEKEAAAAAKARENQSGLGLTQQTMIDLAEAGGVPKRTNTQGTQANQNFDQGLYDLANQAFQGNNQLSSINNLAMPSGSGAFDFDLNNYAGKQANFFNPGVNFGYDDSLDINSGLNQQALPQEMVGTGANPPAGDYVSKSPENMTEAELIDFLTNLDVPVGVGDDLYPVEYLRELAMQLMG
ncbi:hypothetical protein AOL_s00080g224 [Orbilia oligospora ATCC 24927]|uniref:Uncharacterized protein n=1 Tax=Arthrobotrys oligospora (strain ATCC 24927 / CBS 115.81 / DSM 1491) TaxID=756982 RepID=G1XEI9_ARTOA|nr:hypothetical protein AOL_s00080g224 [Orbilia oligospora ATCC 24927]EGX48595.1 hypothetical protein AOL_s00080g224 [Orbilia oligospora ATCC 24927]